jgi:hypothetical protein
MRHGVRIALAVTLLSSACGFPSRTDTVADDLLRRAGSFEPLRSEARHEVVYVDTVAVPADQAYARLLDAYTGVGLAPGHTDREAFVVAGQLASVSEIGGRRADHWLDCATDGAPASAPAGQNVRLWYGSRVVPAAAGSMVHTVLRADTHTRNAPERKPRPCVSRGTLEAEIAGQVRSGAAGGTP